MSNTQTPATRNSDKHSQDAQSQSAVLDAAARLAAAEARIKELEQDIATRDANAMSGLKINPGDRPFAGDNGGWKFRVGPLQASKYEGLETCEIMACDEAEAKRWYCAAHDWPIGSRRAIDPVAIDIKVVCIDERRKQLIYRKAKLSTIRHKLQAGQTLTAEENDLLRDNELEIQGLK